MKDKQYKQLMNNNDNYATNKHVFVCDLCAKQRFREEMKANARSERLFRFRIPSRRTPGTHDGGAGSGMPQGGAVVASSTTQSPQLCPT